MSTADDCLATALAAAFAPEELDIIHGRMVDELVDGAHTPIDDPFGRLVDAIFAASHQGHGCPCPRCRYANAQQLRDDIAGGAPVSTADQERDAALAELRRVIDRLRLDGADVADAHAGCARYAAELIAAALNAGPTVPEHEDPARLRGQLAAALRAVDADPRPATMLRRVPFDCGPEGDDDWGIRYGEALDAAATAQQLRDEITGGAQ